MTTTETPTLIQVDPAMLRVADQVRQDATPDDALIASVRAHGIQQPPIVTSDEGGYVIEIGHRRVGAAIAVGLPLIWVIVRPGGATVDAGTVERQMVENERRKGLSSAEVAQGYAQLEAMFGLTPEDIAAQLGEKPERVRAGIRVATSPRIVEALAAAPTLDLEQVAILAEFEDDPGTVETLLEVARTSPENLAYRVEATRTSRARSTRVEELTEQLRAEGLDVITQAEYNRNDVADIEWLVDENGKPAQKKHANVGYIRTYGAEPEIVYVIRDWKNLGFQNKNGYRSPEELAELEQQRADRDARDQRIAANRAARRRWIHDLLPGKINQLKGVYAYMASALLDAGSGYYHADPRRPEVVLTFLDIPEGDDAAATLDEIVQAGSVHPFRLMLATALAIHEDEAASLSSSHAVVIRHFEQLQKWGYSLTDVDEAVLVSRRELLATQDAVIEAEPNDDEEDVA